jgi:hypothetical protein
MKSQLKNLAIAITFLGVIVVCVMAYRHCAHDWKAIQGEWETVTVTGNGIAGDWIFYTNGLVDGPSGYRSYYSMNPLFRTITWGMESRGTYELDGNNLTIWLDGDKSQIQWTLKKVRTGREITSVIRS